MKLSAFDFNVGAISCGLGVRYLDAQDAIYAWRKSCLRRVSLDTKRLSRPEIVDIVSQFRCVLRKSDVYWSILSDGRVVVAEHADAGQCAEKRVARWFKENS